MSVINTNITSMIGQNNLNKSQANLLSPPGVLGELHNKAPTSPATHLVLM